jgi:hypothetical protein
VGKAIRKTICIARGHVYCSHGSPGWNDVFCLRCGERRLVFNRGVEMHGDDLITHGEYLAILAASAAVTVAGAITAWDYSFIVAGALIATAGTFARIIAMNDNKTHPHWAMCEKTPGCTLEDGHGGTCKLAKGF